MFCVLLLYNGKNYSILLLFFYLFVQGNFIIVNIGENIYVKVLLYNDDFGIKMRLDICEIKFEVVLVLQNIYIIIKNG